MKDLASLGKTAATLYILDRIMSIAMLVFLAATALVVFYKALLPELRGLVQ